jgi:hypothetical protein
MVAALPKQRGAPETGDAGNTAREAPTASRHQKRALLTCRAPSNDSSELAPSGAGPSRGIRLMEIEDWSKRENLF